MNIRTLAAFVIGVTASGVVSAQKLPVQANIPFSFVVNGVTLPAGEYTVRPGDSAATMIVKGTDHAVGAISLATPTLDTAARAQPARLIFHRYGDRYFLSQVWTDGNHGSEFPLTRSERELIANRNSPSQSVAVAVR